MMNSTLKSATTVGVLYIQCLLSNPNKPISVQVLASIKPAGAKSYCNGQSNLTVTGVTDANDITSGRNALREYESRDFSMIAKRLSTLRQEKQSANEACAFDKAEELQYKIEELEQYIKKARSAKNDKGLEKLRTGVKNAVSKAISRIRTYDPLFADYLVERIATGYTCMYKNPPSENVTWYFE